MHGLAQPLGAPLGPAGALWSSLPCKCVVGMPGKFETLLEDLRVGDIAGIAQSVQKLTEHVDASVIFTEERLAMIEGLIEAKFDSVVQKK